MRMLTTKEIAERLKVSRPTVVMLIKGGKLKGIKVNNQYRVTEENFEAFLKSIEVKGEGR